VLGHHNISLGVDIGRRQVLLDNGFNSPGLFTFNGNYTNLAMSDFLLGNLYQFQQAQGQFENTNAWNMGFFIQDDYKVTPRLTLQPGPPMGTLSTVARGFCACGGFLISELLGGNRIPGLSERAPGSVVPRR
jgi:hypothetical protein